MNNIKWDKEVVIGTTMNKEWGEIEFISTFARGIKFVTAKNIKGFILNRSRIKELRRQRLPSKRYFRENNNELAFLILGFPELFTKNQQRMAHQIAKEHFPREYERFLGGPPYFEARKESQFRHRLHGRNQGIR